MPKRRKKKQREHIGLMIGLCSLAVFLGSAIVAWALTPNAGVRPTDLVGYTSTPTELIPSAVIPAVNGAR